MQSESSLPEKFLEQLPLYIPKEHIQSALEAFYKPRSATFRVNTIKTNRNTLTNMLENDGFFIEQLSWYNDAFILKNKSKQDLMNTKVYKEGLMYIQNVSSMIPPLALNPQPQQTILDMAASPGSKTTQLACLMQNSGEIIANDKSPKRLFKLMANLKEQGVTNTKMLALPGEFLWKKFPQYFDAVLLDAPCSMEGRFNSNESDSYKDWSPRKIKELANLQKWLLRSAVSCTKVGGTIVYSTCALSPQENEEVVDWLLKKLGAAVQLEEIAIPHLPASPGLTSFQKKTFSSDLSKTFRIYPTALMEGFFVAKFRKMLPTV